MSKAAFSIILMVTILLGCKQNDSVDNQPKDNNSQEEENNIRRHDSIAKYNKQKKVKDSLFITNLKNTKSVDIDWRYVINEERSILWIDQDKIPKYDFLFQWQDYYINKVVLEQIDNFDIFKSKGNYYFRERSSLTGTEYKYLRLTVTLRDKLVSLIKKRTYRDPDTDDSGNNKNFFIIYKIDKLRLPTKSWNYYPEYVTAYDEDGYDLDLDSYYEERKREADIIGQVIDVYFLED